jgi:hypothetical protein
MASDPDSDDYLQQLRYSLYLQSLRQSIQFLTIRSHGGVSEPDTMSASPGGASGVRMGSGTGTTAQSPHRARKRPLRVAG